MSIPILPDQISEQAPTTLRVRVRWRGEIVLYGARKHVRAAEAALRAAKPIEGEALRGLLLHCEPDDTHPEAEALAQRLGLPAGTPWEDCLRRVDLLRHPHRELAEQLGESPDTPAEEVIRRARRHRDELRELSEELIGERDAPQAERRQALAAYWADRRAIAAELGIPEDATHAERIAALREHRRRRA